MSGPSPSAPKGPESVSSNSLIWAVLAAGLAIGIFVCSGRVEPEKKTFYLLAGALGAVTAAVNGYGA